MFTESIPNDEPNCAHDFSNNTWFAPERINDHPFSGVLVPRTKSASSLLASVLIDFEAVEKLTNSRKRKRRPADMSLFLKQVEAVLCEAIYRELITPEEWLSISFSHRNLGIKGDRYTPSIFTEKLVYVIKTLAKPEMGLLELELGRRDFQNPSLSCISVFRASPMLVQKIGPIGLSLADFATSLDMETIVLKAPKATRRARAQRVNYADDSVTTAYRQEMSIINTWLHQADIKCIPCSSVLDDTLVDVTRRTLTRTFSNGNFAECGRLFGGFWIDMKKAHRSGCLRIHGMKIVELDYKSMIARLLYAHAQEVMPQEDAYSIPGLEGNREGVKMLFSTMLHDNKPRIRYPHGVASMFPKRTKVGEVIKRIVDAHPRVTQYFGTGIGLHLMFKESEIMVDLLLALKQMGIVALPIHDAVLVPEGTEDCVMRVMVDAFQSHTGIQGVVVKG